MKAAKASGESSLPVKHNADEKFSVRTLTPDLRTGFKLERDRRMPDSGEHRLRKGARMKIELLYDRECPNVSATRSNLSRALTSLNLPGVWTEWEQSSADVPAYARGFGSPTVLIDGRDVADEPASAEASCCRLYDSSKDGRSGVPSLALIEAALVQRQTG